MSQKLNGSMSHKNDFNNITAKIDFFSSFKNKYWSMLQILNCWKLGALNMYSKKLTSGLNSDQRKNIDINSLEL